MSLNKLASAIVERNAVKEAGIAPTWLTQGLKNAKGTVGTLGDDVKHITNTSRDGWVRGEVMPFARGVRDVGAQYVKGNPGVVKGVNTWAFNKATGWVHNPNLRRLLDYTIL